MRAAADDVGGWFGEGAAEAGGDEVEAKPALLFAVQAWGCALGLAVGVVAIIGIVAVVEDVDAVDVVCCARSFLGGWMVGSGWVCGCEGVGLYEVLESVFLSNLFLCSSFSCIFCLSVYILL